MCGCLLQLLHVVQPLVVSAELQQLLVCAAFHDASFVEHTYLVSILDSGQAVGNGYGGAC